ncbi:hypothetical protein EI019_24920 [Escherichia coli]|nr:hypothetical protein [Escherichia coli]
MSAEFICHIFTDALTLVPVALLNNKTLGDVIFVTEKSYTESIVMGVENDGCKCGASCSCTDCTCGH